MHAKIRRLGRTAWQLLTGALLLHDPSLAPAQDGLPRPDHTVIVIEENKSFGRIMGAPGAPYINELATRGALFTSFYAIRHPSQPNYLALFSGSTHGIGDDSCPHTFNGPNLGSALLGAGLTFAGYSESMPRMGYHGCSAGGYERKHNPWVNFPNVPDDANLTWPSFPTDYDNLPTVSIVVPNQNNDMHDGPIARGDQWLRDNLSAYIDWAQTHNSLFILTWDEGNPSIENRVVTIFVGPMVQPGEYSERLNHYSLLRTLLSMYGLAPFAKAADTDPISSAWTAEASAFPVNVTLTSPVDQTQVAGPTSLPLAAEASASDAVIARVEFFDRGTKLGEVTTAPFQFTATNLALGEHSFNAQATDNLGHKRISHSARVQLFNPFDSWAGSYQGLVVNPDAPSPETSAAFTLSLDTAGGFTAKVAGEAKTFRFAGRFDRAGTAVASVPFSSGTNADARLECALQIDFANALAQLHGELSQLTGGEQGQPAGRTPLATVLADRVRQRSPTNSLPETGRHTLLLLGEGDGSRSPGGHGFAQVTVSSAGAVKASGRLADGTVLAASSKLTERERWPLYQRLTRPDGVLLGWIWFTNGKSFSATAMGGEVTWMRHAGLTGQYSAGFTNVVEVLGSAYVPPRGAASGVLPWTNGIFVLDGAGYASPITNAVQLDVAGKVQGSNIALRVTPGTGLWRATGPQFEGITEMQGAVLQSSGIGLGYFLGPNGSGRVRLAAQ